MPMTDAISTCPSISTANFDFMTSTIQRYIIETNIFENAKRYIGMFNASPLMQSLDFGRMIMSFCHTHTRNQILEAEPNGNIYATITHRNNSLLIALLFAASCKTHSHFCSALLRSPSLRYASFFIFAQNISKKMKNTVRWVCFFYW